MKSRLSRIKPIIVQHIDPEFLVINKPSGIKSYGYDKPDSVIPQLNRLFQSNEFRLVQRLDRFVSGGLVVARTSRFAKWYSKVLSEGNEISRQYIGLIAIPQEYQSIQNYIRQKLQYKLGDSQYKGLVFANEQLDQGEISHDVEVLARDDRNKSAKKRALQHSDQSRVFEQKNAFTKFKIITELVRKDDRFPLFKDKLIVPIAIQLKTGRKNQIRDHIIQAFKVPLLNDENFVKFKAISINKDLKVNSELYETNQIGLHCARIAFNNQEFVIPLHKEDNQLFRSLTNKHGVLNPKVIHAMRSLNSSAASF